MIKVTISKRKHMKLFSSLKNRAQAYLAEYKQKDAATYAAAQQAVGGLLIIDGFIGIDNPLGGKKRPGIFGSLIGIGMGVLFMFIPSVFNSLSGLDKMTATTSATVVSVATSSSDSNTCALTAKYTVEGVERTSRSADSSSTNCGKAVGDTLTINYNPQNPSAWSSDMRTFGLVFGIFFWAGIVLAITSFGTFIIRLISIIFGWKILQSGRALAKTLPQGTNLATVVEEIKQRFKGSVFVSSPSAPQDQNSMTQTILSAMTTGVSPTAVAPTVSPLPPQSPAPTVSPEEPTIPNQQSTATPQTSTNMAPEEPPLSPPSPPTQPS